jgi:hypothetical protein
MRAQSFSDRKNGKEARGRSPFLSRVEMAGHQFCLRECRAANTLPPACLLTLHVCPEQEM